jgi:SAM-dependent methyltransferase
MREFRRESEFDAVIHWWNSFGYFETREDNLEVLENMKASLKEGGGLVMEIWSKELFAQKGLDKRWSEQDQDTFLLEEHEVKDDWNKVESTWIRATEEGLNKVEWSKKIYSAKELEDMLEEAGFSEIEFYGTLEEDPYNFEAERLFVKAMK